MRRAFGIALVVVLALVFINDIGRWVNAQSRLNEDTSRLAEWAATNVQDDSRAVGSPIVIAEGAKRGVRVDRYDSDQYTVQVWSSVDVFGTWVIGPSVAAAEGTPLDRVIGAPFVVSSNQHAQFQ